MPTQHQSTVGTPLDQAFILRLPDELLHRIIQLSSRGSLWRGYLKNGACQAAAALTLVCRRFNYIATACLYSDLLIDCDRQNPKVVLRGITQLLHRSLRQNPSLWPSCQRLTIVNHGSDKSGLTNMYVAIDLVTWLVATKALTIITTEKNMSEEFYLVRLAVEHMVGLKMLRIIDQGWDAVDLSLVIDSIGYLGCGACLRTLDISGISTFDDIARTRLREMAGTASFTVLKLRSFLQTPEVLQDLVRWPAKLEKFDFQYSFGVYWGSEGLYTTWSLRTLRSVLIIHKATLSHIKIRGLNCSGLTNFDLSEFINLEELSLSRGTTGDNPSLVANLFAPRLHTFEWVMNLDYEQCLQRDEKLELIGPPEEAWLHAFAETAVALKSPLHKVRIVFTPDTSLGEYFWKLTRENVQYPWDRLDRIGREFQPAGIQVVYNTPTITKEDFFAEYESLHQKHCKRLSSVPPQSPT